MLPDTAAALPAEHLWEETLEDPRILPEFQNVADPLIWLTELQTGLHYRRATSAELSANAWPAGTYLIELGPLGDVRTGIDYVEMIIPRSDADVRAIVLKRISTETDPMYVEERVQPDGSVVTAALGPATFHEYRTEHTDQELQDWVDTGNGPVLELTSLHQGGYTGVGLNDDALIEFLGPEEHWYVQDLPTADGRTVDRSNVAVIVLTVSGVNVPASSHCPLNLTLVCSLTCSTLGRFCPPVPQCNDGRDNDGDNWVDYPADPGCTSRTDNNEGNDPEKTYRYGLFGEGKWCTDNKANWQTLLRDVASGIEPTFETRNGGTLANLDYRVGGCIIFSSASDATKCDQGSIFCTVSYVYKGCDSSAPCYRDRVWQDVQNKRASNTFDTLHSAQVIHNGVMTSPWGNVCGLASFPEGSPNFGSSSGPAPSGDSVTVKTHTSCAPYVPGHEMGHVFDALHPGDQPNSSDRTACKGFIMDGGNTLRSDSFCDANRKRVNRCVTTMSNCPRTGTG